MFVRIKKNSKVVTTQDFISWYDVIKWIVDREQKSSIVPCLWDSTDIDEIDYYINESKENCEDVVDYYENMLNALKQGYMILDDGDGEYAQFKEEELQDAHDVNGVLRDARMADYSVKEVD